MSRITEALERAQRDAEQSGGSLRLPGSWKGPTRSWLISVLGCALLVVGAMWWIGGREEREASGIYQRATELLRNGSVDEGRAELAGLAISRSQSAWADDALWELAQSHETAEESREAASIYERLLTEHPDSPFASAATERLAQLRGGVETADLAGAETIYEVQPGDTLSRIAREFGTTVERIRQANRLTGDLIYPKQRLKILTSDASPAGTPTESEANL